MLYINENILCRSISEHHSFLDLELKAIEINQNKRKRPIIGPYKPSA